MVKQEVSLKGHEIEQQAEQVLFELLGRVPGIYIDRNPSYPQFLPNAPKPDIRLRVSHQDDTFDLICEVKSNGQRRIAYSTIFHLRQQSAKYNTPILLVLAAPFLSKEVRELCVQEGISYFDLSGNARIAFGAVYIEREAPDNLFKEIRETRSLFTPKAARILRVMFRDAGSNASPYWRVTDLAEKAKVSLGQVSNIGKALVDAEFAKKDERGLALLTPGKLLEAWLKAYKPPEGEAHSYYTTLHGTQLIETLKPVLGGPDENGRVILSGFSAAQWLAPHVRSGSTSLYADRKGLDRLKSLVPLSTASRGDNVSVRLLIDDGPLDDAVEAADNIWCTSPIQTCLDLSWAGDRGQEAAQMIHQKWFPWQ